jgi:ABC-type amino acid transport substrate-binding protein
MDAWWRSLPLRFRRMDIAAVLVLIGYAFLAAITQLGASVAGQGPDPVWAAARQRGALRVAVDFGYYPFSGLAQGQPVGYDIDLARAVAQRLGLGVEFVPSNLDSIYDDLANHRADLAASALPYAPEQGWRASFSSFYFNAGQVLVVPEHSLIAGVEQLGGHVIGAPLGSDADTYARRLVSGNASITLRSDYDTPAAALADLRRGKLDAAIVDNASALSDLGHQPGLKAVGPALTLEPYVLAVPVEAYQLHDAVNRALEELRQAGFFEQVGKKWFVDAPLSGMRGAGSVKGFHLPNEWLPDAPKRPGSACQGLVQHVGQPDANALHAVRRRMGAFTIHGLAVLMRSTAPIRACQGATAFDGLGPARSRFCNSHVLVLRPSYSDALTKDEGRRTKVCRSSLRLSSSVFRPIYFTRTKSWLCVMVAKKNLLW